MQHTLKPPQREYDTAQSSVICELVFNQYLPFTKYLTVFHVNLDRDMVIKVDS